MRQPPDIPSCRYLPIGTPCPTPNDCTCNREVSASTTTSMLLLVIIAAAICGVAIACYDVVGKAYGADNLAPCLTKQQAKAKYPHAWLYWHGPDHCWDNQRGRRQTAPAPIARTIPVARSAPHQTSEGVQGPTVAFPPTMAGVGTINDMLRPEAMTRWPLVFDFDDDAPRFEPWRERVSQ